ncbi:MAG TPA: cobalamin-independent methionine synthase II family protein [Pseudonocardia sp.]|jgi:5-methyltetrahydropteroyltriglutamate--homocysteine methyltransferase|nr:cobalamin-independent methionine synthase II family protein [Pseudonocardia sp.]
MFTATDGLALATTVTGSWPRPRWFDLNLGGRSLSERMTDMRYREQFLDATAALISNQEQAGLDIVVNGDYHHDDDLGGMAWVAYNWERLGGTDPDNRTMTTSWPQNPGTLLNSVMGGWRFAPVVDKLRPRVPLELDKLWRLTQGMTDRPVKLGTISSQTVAAFVQNKSSYYDDDRRQLTMDLSEIVNTELRAMAASGATVIQIEDPMIHLLPEGTPREHVDFLIDALNREIEGLENCEVWLHTCWGNPNMQRVVHDVSYRSAIEDYLYRVNCDVLTVEMCDSDLREIDMFADYRDARKKIAVGVISHRTLQVDEGEGIAANIRTAARYIDPERLVLSSDCGFGRAGFNRAVAHHKAAALVRAANVVRKELGFPVTESRNDNPRLQMDYA